MKDFFFTLVKYSLFMISLILFMAKVLCVCYLFVFVHNFNENIIHIGHHLFK